MSIKNEDSLNCPCNGIYKCGLHSTVLPFPKINNPSEMLRAVEDQYNDESNFVKLLSKITTK